MDRSPRHLLKEIVLVDDASDMRKKKHYDVSHWIPLTRFLWFSSPCGAAGELHEQVLQGKGGAGEGAGGADQGEADGGEARHGGRTHLPRLTLRVHNRYGRI